MNLRNLLEKIEKRRGVHVGERRSARFFSSSDNAFDSNPVTCASKTPIEIIVKIRKT